MAKSSSDTHFFRGIKVACKGRNPKVHGEIQGFPVGSSWSSRVGCSEAGVHAPLRAGIHGNATDGAYSIVLSGGYEDDEDNGEMITYTGQGGRDTKGTLMDQLRGRKLWEGAQSADQEWVLGNKALKISCTTKKPVRVVRGYSLKSLYAPTEGYRYDGLYIVDKAWRAVGKTGFHTCRFNFRRLPNQLPIPGTRPSTQKLMQQSQPKLESGVRGLLTPGAGPSTLHLSSSTSLGPAPFQSVPSVRINTVRITPNKPSVPPTPKSPFSPVSLRPAPSRLNVVTGTVQNLLDKPLVPPTPNRPHAQTHLSRPHPITIAPLSRPLKRGRDDYHPPRTPSRSSRPPLSSVDPHMSRLSAVAPLQMVQVQRSLKRPRGERVTNNDAGGVPMQRLNISSQLDSTPQTPRRIVTVQRANKYAHMKFKKQKTEN